MVAWGCLGTRLGVDIRRLTFPIQGSRISPDRGGRTRTARRGTRSKNVLRALRQKNALNHWQVKPDFCDRESGGGQGQWLRCEGCACGNRISCDRGHRRAQLTSHK